MKGKRWWIVCAAVVPALAGLILLISGREPYDPSGTQKPAETDAVILTEEPTDGAAAAPTEEPTEEASESPVPTKAPRVTRAPTEAPTFHAEKPEPTVTPDPWNTRVIAPDCLNDGVILHENVTEGTTVAEAGEPAPGHDWSEWEPCEGGYRHICRRCGWEETRPELHEGKLPRIDFTGSLEGISKTERVITGFRFSGPDTFFQGYTYSTWQGHTTLAFPKKNYMVRIYEDEELNSRHRFRFSHWKPEHKYVLKANYRDVSGMRNLIAAGLWADMVCRRPGLYKGLRDTPNYGAADGFPVLLYINDAFAGLYTMNLHIDDDLYRMNHREDAVMIANQAEPDETRFLAQAAFTDEKSAWEVEYCGSGEDNQWARDALNELIRFVMESSDGEFRTGLSERLDVDAAIDYLIFLYVTGLKENNAKDLVLLKYYDCNRWIPTVYDLEAAFGLNLAGMTYRPADEFLPERRGDGLASGTDSLLWERLLKSFEPEIRARYAELRKNVLSEENLIRRIQDALAQIPAEYREMDLALYPREVPDADPEKQMTEYIRERLPLLDSLLGEAK